MPPRMTGMHKYLQMENLLTLCLHLTIVVTAPVIQQWSEWTSCNLKKKLGAS